MLYDCGFFLIVDERMTIEQWQEARRCAERIRDSYERGLEVEQSLKKKKEVQEARPEGARPEGARPEGARPEEARLSEVQDSEEAIFNEPAENYSEVLTTKTSTNKTVATRKNRQCIASACIYSR